MAESIEIYKKSLARRPTAESVMDYGKLPPQAVELETAVLGAILIDSKAMIEVADTLSADAFYRDQNQRVYRAISILYNKGEAIDILTVSEQLKQAGELDAAGGCHYVATLSNSVGSAANIYGHALIVAEKYMLRQLISRCTEVIKDAYEDTSDAFEVLGKAESITDSISGNINSGETFYDTVINRTHELTEAHKNFTKPGLMTYLPKFDNHIGGFLENELIIIAGRPAMGKTAVMCDFSYHQALNQIPVGIFTLEMSRKQLVDRYNSIASGVEYEKMRRVNMTEGELSQMSKSAMSVAELPIQINDEGGIGINKLCSIAKMWKHKHGIRALYIDYLQKVSAFDAGIKFGSKDEQITYISSKLKSLAMSLRIPVIALAQLSRAVETRGGDKRPIPSDLRESGSIEQDADLIIFPFRPSYYELNDDNGNPYSDNYCELIIAKFRSGAAKDLITEFYPQFSRFKREEYEQQNWKPIRPPVRDFTEPSKSDDTPF